jgi:DNA-binding SARP family transcriptional activator
MDRRQPATEIEQHVRVGLLGSFELHVLGVSVRIGSASQRRILSLLALQAGEVVSVDALVDALWPDAPPPTAVLSLRNQISRMRNAIGPAKIVAGPRGYSLAIPPNAVDVHRFESKLTDNGSTLADIDEALALWRGTPLAEFAFEDWARPITARLSEREAVAREQRLHFLIEANRAEVAVVEATALSAQRPERESVQALLMAALARTGRSADALRSFQSFRTRTIECAGVEPSEALRDVERSILDGAIHATFPKVSSPVRPEDDASRQALALPAGLVVSFDSLPLTGRSDDLQVLEGLLKSTQEFGSVAALVIGEAGIGKSRLVAEFATQSHRDGVAVVFGRCDEDLVSGLFPFTQIARQMARTALGENADFLHRIANLGALTNVEPAYSDEETFALFDSFATYLATAAQTWRGLIVVIEDVHWADRDSLALLRYLIRTRSSAPLLFVCTSRDEKADPASPFSKLLADLRRSPSVSRIELGGLDVDAVTELANHANITGNLGLRIHKRTSGNPFFVTELLAAGASEHVPLSARDVVSHRAARLGLEAHKSLRIAATIGQEFDLSVLRDVTARDEESLLNDLQRATDIHLIEEVGIDVWRFRHALSREALSSELSASLRARIHANIASAIAQLRPTNLAELAFHFDHAGPNFRRQALDHFDLLGRRARDSHSLAEAAHAFARVVSLTDELSPEDIVSRAEVRIHAAKAQNAIGDPAWSDAAHTAVKLSHSVNRSDIVVAAALTGANTVGHRNLYEVDHNSVEAVTIALSVADSDRDRARLLARLSALLVVEGNGDRSAATARQAIEAARLCNDERTLATVLSGTLRALCRPSQCFDITERLKELDEHIEKLGAENLRLDGAIHRATEYARVGDLSGIDSCIKVLDAAVERGSVLARRSRSQIQFYRRLSVGDLVAAEAFATEALEDGLRTSFVGAELVWRAQMLNLGTYTGQVFDMPKLEGKDPLAGSSMTTSFQALTAAALGRSEESLSLLAAATNENFVAVPENYQWWSAMALWSGAPFILRIANVDDPRVGQSARAIETLLTPHRGTFATAQVSLEKPIDISLGFTAFADNRPLEAIANFESAVELCDRTGITLHAAGARVFLAFAIAHHYGAVEAQRVGSLLDIAEAWSTTNNTNQFQGLNHLARHLVSNVT